MIFLLRQFIMTIPREFDEAATIDGANPLRILATVLLPLMKPVLATMAVMTFIGGWNDFMGPLIYLGSPEKFTLALGIRYFNVAPNQAAVPAKSPAHGILCDVHHASDPAVLFGAAILCPGYRDVRDQGVRQPSRQAAGIRGEGGDSQPDHCHVSRAMY